MGYYISNMPAPMKAQTAKSLAIENSLAYLYFLVRGKYVKVKIKQPQSLGSANCMVKIK